MKKIVLNILLAMAMCCGFAGAEELIGKNGDYVKVKVKNPLSIKRECETIELDLAEYVGKSNISKVNVAVYSFSSKSLIVSQVLELEGKTALLFQSGFDAGEEKEFAILAKPQEVKAAESKLSTFVDFYPKRHDDIAWENDKMAARMYGLGLEWETISSGIDLWCKEVARPILAQKYSEYIDKKMSYHNSRGIGGDYYKVGVTLGCGGNAIYNGGKLYMPAHNFSSHKILANGPIRSIFELNYDKWDAGGISVSETMRVSVDLGSYLCKVEAKFDSDKDKLPVATGIITRPEGGEIYNAPADGWTGYWQPKENFGTICCGVIVPKSSKVKSELAQNHTLLTREVKKGESFTYYTGGTWDKAGEITSFEIWKQYLAQSSKTINTPLIISK